MLEAFLIETCFIEAIASLCFAKLNETSCRPEELTQEKMQEQPCHHHPPPLISVTMRNLPSCQPMLPHSWQHATPYGAQVTIDLP